MEEIPVRIRVIVLASRKLGAFDFNNLKVFTNNNF
ncbi:Uncharacterised protein [Streptococcus pyogenes]|nr:Uncharacterised protein [Streptococcus pyogenes]VGS08973.1 Uncharacterised protein [Streptococcus pyogenes]VGW17694.1 Uncharacterised protein [Streptococcus pyogenes]